jgi:hypothetical protein
VPFIPAKNYVEVNDHILGDGHWNESGHQRIAQLLESLYQEHGRIDGAQNLDRLSFNFVSGAGPSKRALA